METKNSAKIKVIIAKLGLDGHNRGALVVSMALRDAGMEVIYTGLHQSPEKVASIALQEDVDAIGISSMVDAHRTLVPKLIKELKKKNIANIPVILGGFIQPEDVTDLKNCGVAEIFGLDSRLSDIVTFIKNLCSKKTNVLSSVDLPRDF